MKYISPCEAIAKEVVEYSNSSDLVYKIKSIVVNRDSRG